MEKDLDLTVITLDGRRLTFRCSRWAMTARALWAVSNTRFGGFFFKRAA